MTERAPNLLVIFDSLAELERASEWAHAEGLKQFDALSPYAAEKISSLIPRERDQWWFTRIFFRNLNVLGAIALMAGLGGMASGFGVQWLANSWAFPLNAGGRPYFSWPNFVPITFALAILFAAGAVFLGLILALRLPEPHHAVFDSSLYNLAEERFYLLISREDPRFREAALLQRFPSARVEELKP